MIEQEQIVREKIAGFLKWERTKRREKTLISSFFYALLVSSFLLPAQFWFPWLSPFSLLLIFFLLFTTFSFLRRPWSQKDSQRTLWLVDRKLDLAERTLTANEILDRGGKKTTELLVLREAGEKLTGIDPERLFKRKYSWDFLVTPLLLIFWLLSFWFDVGPQVRHRPEQSTHLSIARRLKAFSSEVREKSKSQGLTQSLETAQALKDLAEQNLQGQLGEKELNENLAGMAGRIGETMSQLTQSGGSPTVADRDSLDGLRSEIDAFQGSLALQRPGHWDARLAPELLGKLASLPHLSGELERRFPQADKMSQRDLSDFVEQLERNLRTQMDRLTLAEIQQYLEQLLGKTEGESLESTQQARGEAPGKPVEGEKADVKGRMPGTEAGSKEETNPAGPSLQAQAPRQLRGQLGEGKSTSLSLNVEPPPGKSKVPQEEMLANYRRQAEEDLASEKIPEGLKETIRKYFLSLGKAGEKK